MPTYPMTAASYDLVYNATSFTLASMMTTTIFCWLRLPSVAEKYKTALVITGLVTFIAACHYIRIFNSWVDAYEFGTDSADPSVTGKPFNDAYRYMDWLLTVPLLLIEIIFCMKLPDDEMTSLAWKMGSAAAAMIVLGYPGESIIEGDLSSRWMYWALGMLPFLYIVYTLLIGLTDAVGKESDPKVKNMLKLACQATVVSWCTYPVVYILPMFGYSAENTVVGIQLGYCFADIIAKCGVGFLIYNITITKSAQEGLLGK